MSDEDMKVQAFEVDMDEDEFKEFIKKLMEAAENDTLEEFMEQHARDLHEVHPGNDTVH